MARRLDRRKAVLKSVFASRTIYQSFLPTTCDGMPSNFAMVKNASRFSLHRRCRTAGNNICSLDAATMNGGRLLPSQTPFDGMQTSITTIIMVFYTFMRMLFISIGHKVYTSHLAPFLQQIVPCIRYSMASPESVGIPILCLPSSSKR
jgi:hypothetical protein